MKVALLIGSNKYEHKRANRLKTGIADATELSNLLKSCGFEVILYEDASFGDIYSAAREVRRRTFHSRIETLVFGYFGHGLRVDGIDYLADIKARFDQNIDPAREMIPLHRLLDDIKVDPISTQLTILATCRDDPLTNTYAERERTRGSVAIDYTKTARDGRMSVNAHQFCSIYAAKEGRVAYDTMDGSENSPFVHFLLANLRDKSKSLEAALHDMARAVEAETHERSKGPQEPKWETNFGLSNWSLHGASYLDALPDIRQSLPVARTPSELVVRMRGNNLAPDQW